MIKDGHLVYDVEAASGTVQNAGSGTLAYSDLTSLSSQAKTLAETLLEEAYPDGYGSKRDAAAEILTGKTLAKILSSYAVASSDGTFTLETSAAQPSTSVAVKGSVNVYIYDASGKLCGAVENDAVDESYDSVFLYVEDGVRYFALTGADYRVKLVGTADGTIDYVVSEYEGDMLTRTIAFNGVTVSEGTTYETSVPEESNLDASLYYLYNTASGSEITPSADTLAASETKRVFVTGVSVSQNTAQLTIDGSLTLSAAVKPTNADVKNVRWCSSNLDVAKVDAGGAVTAVGAGTAVITVATYDGGFTDSCTVTVKLKSGKSAKIQVKVQKKSVKTTGIKLNKTSLTLKRGKTYQLTATITPITSLQKVKYKSSNKKVATVTSKGKIKAKKKGTAMITVTSGSKKVKCKVKVK